MSGQPTPGPWRIALDIFDDDGTIEVVVEPVEPGPFICTLPTELKPSAEEGWGVAWVTTEYANARFIVQACNAHDELLSVVHKLLADSARVGHAPGYWYVHEELLQMARKAIAKAEGRE